jgi:hypothetical protein
LILLDYSVSKCTDDFFYYYFLRMDFFKSCDESLIAMIVQIAH